MHSVLGRWALAMVGLVFLGPSAAARAEESIQVDLREGRTVRGLVDSQTDDAQLTLRREAAGIVLRNSYAWDEIASISRDGRTIPPPRFRALAERVKTPGPKPHEVAAYPPARGRPERRDEPRGNSYSGWPTRAAGRPESLHISAYLGQWNRDAAADGLILRVAVVDERGELVPVDGQLEYTLAGEVVKYNGPRHDRMQGDFRELARGHQIVRREDFARGEAVYRLPFETFHPDRDTDVARRGLLHVRLGVPSVGVFEASDANVELRSFSRFRDELQNFEGQRFLPLENIPWPASGARRLFERP